MINRIKEHYKAKLAEQNLSWVKYNLRYFKKLNPDYSISQSSPTNPAKGSNSVSPAPDPAAPEPIPTNIDYEEKINTIKDTYMTALINKK